jgi:hypothetical protein
MIRVIKANRAKILHEAAQTILGTCTQFSFEDMIYGGILQVCSPEGFGANFTHFCNYVEENIEGLSSEYSTEELEKECQDQEIVLCLGCHWWCDDVHHDSENPDESVCGECHDGMTCGDCGLLECECEE